MNFARPRQPVPATARVVWASGRAGQSAAKRCSSGRTAARSAPKKAKRPSLERARVTTPAGSRPGTGAAPSTRQRSRRPGSARGLARLLARGARARLRRALGARGGSRDLGLAQAVAHAPGSWSRWSWACRSATDSGPRPARPCARLSEIFIRMIKTIIAPLLFATLVVGIAGHPQPAPRGPDGECRRSSTSRTLTTLALFIGLAAINLSQVRGRLDLPRPALREVDRGEPDEERERRDDLEVDERLHSHPAHVAQVGVPRDAHHERREQERRDDGLDHPDEDLAEHAHGRAGLGPVVADRHAHDHRDEDPGRERPPAPGPDRETRRERPAPGEAERGRREQPAERGRERSQGDESPAECWEPRRPPDGAGWRRHARPLRPGPPSRSRSAAGRCVSTRRRSAAGSSRRSPTRRAPWPEPAGAAARSSSRE